MLNVFFNYGFIIYIWQNNIIFIIQWFVWDFLCLVPKVSTESFVNFLNPHIKTKSQGTNYSNLRCFDKFYLNQGFLVALFIKPVPRHVDALTHILLFKLLVPVFKTLNSWIVWFKNLSWEFDKLVNNFCLL